MRRLLLLVADLMLLAGCVSREVDTMEIRSPEFEDGDMMPEKYGYTKDNIHPPLEFSDVPEDAVSLVLLMDDPDAEPVAGKIWDHWVVWNIPAGTKSLEEGELPERAVEGSNDFGGNGYGGPNPPDSTHEYRFRIYALDYWIEFTEGATKSELLDAIEGTTLAKGEMTGLYSPS